MFSAVVVGTTSIGNLYPEAIVLGTLLVNRTCSVGTIGGEVSASNAGVESLGFCFKPIQSYGCIRDAYSSEVKIPTKLATSVDFNLCGVYV